MSLQAKDIINGCKSRPLLVGCVSLGIVLLASFYLRKDMIGQTETVLEERSKSLKKLNANVANAAQLDQQIAKLKAINESFVEGAMSVGELATNQQIFLRLESETGIKLVDLQPQPPPKVSPVANPKAPPASAYVIMRFTVSISGDYRQLIDFLKRLERAPALSRLTSATISGSDQGGDIHLMNINVEFLGVRK